MMDDGGFELDLDALDRLNRAADSTLWCWPVRYELTVDARGSDGIAPARTWLPWPLPDSGSGREDPRR